MNVRKPCYIQLFLTLCMSLLFSWQARAQQREIGWILPPDYEAAAIDESSVIRAKIDGKWGLFDYDGKVVMAPRYEEIGKFVEGYAPFIQDNKIGFLDTLGNVVLPARYAPEDPDSMDMVFDNPSVKYHVNAFQGGAVVVNDNGVYRLIGKTGENLLDNDIRIEKRSGDVLIIRRHSMYGLAGLHGEILVEPRYARIDEILPGELFSFFVMGSLGLFNELGESISERRFLDVQAYTGYGNSLARVWYEDGKQALLDKDGNMLFEPLYQSVLPMEVPGFYVVEQQGYVGVARGDGTMVVPLEYKKIRPLAGPDTLFVAQKDYHYTVFDAQGKIHYSGTDRVIVDMAPSGDLITWSEGFCGVMNADGAWVLEPQYEEIYLVLGHVVAAKHKGRFGAVDMKTKEILVPFNFKRVKSPEEGNYFAFFDAKDSSVLCTQDGNMVRFMPTKEVEVFDKYAVFTYKKNKGRQYVDGTYITPEYSSVITFDERYMAVQTSKGWQYIDRKTKKPIIPAYFSSASYFANGYTVAMNEGKIQFLDENLHVIFTLCRDCNSAISALLEITMARMKNQDYSVVTIDKKQGVLNLKR